MPEKQVGLTRFEPAIFTPQVFEQSDANAANHGTKPDSRERLHQIAESSERDVVGLLLETIDDDVVERVLAALSDSQN